MKTSVLLCAFAIARVTAQDTLHFVPTDRVTVRDLARVPFDTLGPGLRVKTVVGGTGSFSFAELDSGASTRAHHHTREQIDVGLIGTPDFVVDGHAYPLGLAAGVVVPPNATHFAVNNHDRTTVTIVELHTVRRPDIVPPYPRMTYPASAEPVHVANPDALYVPGDGGATRSLEGGTSAYVTMRFTGGREATIPPVDGEQFLYVADGGGVIVAGGSQQTLASGFVAVVPPNTPGVRILPAPNLLVLTFRTGAVAATIAH